MKNNIHFLSYLAQFFLELEIFQRRENQNTHFMFNNFFVFRKSCHLWGNAAKFWWQYGACAFHAEHPSLQTHMLRICNTYAIPLQQWLHERASILRYMYSACLVASDLGISLRARDNLTRWL